MEILNQNPNFDPTRFFAQVDAIVEKYVERTGPIDKLVPGSIHFSDGLCIGALCELYEVDYLIEAGRGNGGSTEMFARYFDDHPKVRRIWSVDLRVHPLVLRFFRLIRSDRYPARHVWPTDIHQKIARDRLKMFKNVSLVEGDACRKIPKILRGIDLKRYRVGLFLDGPKEAAQMQLANQLLDASPNICFAALDDVGRKLRARFQRLSENPRAVFCTDDTDYLTRYGWLNKGESPSLRPNGVGVLINMPPAG